MYSCKSLPECLKLLIPIPAYRVIVINEYFCKFNSYFLTKTLKFKKKKSINMLNF